MFMDMAILVERQVTNRILIKHVQLNGVLCCIKYILLYIVYTAQNRIFRQQNENEMLTEYLMLLNSLFYNQMCQLSIE